MAKNPEKKSRIRQSRLPGPFQSASGISTLGALRFELNWRYRDQELPREKQESHV